MILNTLVQIGFDEKQAKIYLACLELGKTTIKEMAKKAEIKRTTVYDIIDEMIDYGYIKKTTQGKKVKFVAVEPVELKEIIKKRESLLNQILPSLNSINNVNVNKPKVWFYDGVEGIKQVYEDLLNYKNIEVWGWGSEDSTDLLGLDWCSKYVTRRVGKKIKLKIIYPLTEITKYYKKNDETQGRDSKIVDPKKYLFNVEINIYSNRLAIMSAKDKIGVIIESEPITATLKTIFRICWDNLK
jgi:HTH-type transcriptional regulator, sugar sensing transcriptional regulator